MSDEPEGLRFVPGGARVCAEPAMEQREAGDEPGVFKVEVKPVERIGARECLVDDCRPGEGGEIKLLVDPLVRLLAPDSLFRGIQKPVERRVGPAVPGAPDDRMLHRRHGREPFLAEDGTVDGDIPVGDDLQSEKAERALKYLQREVHPLFRTRHEEGRHGHLPPFVSEEVERDVGHDARTVPCHKVRSARPPVFNTAESVERFLQDLVRACTRACGNEPNAAAVMLLTVERRSIHSENAFSMSTKKAGDTQAGTRGFAAEERPGCAPGAPPLKLVPFFPTFFSFYVGEVAEWLKALVSKTSIGVSLSRVIQGFLQVLR